MPVKLHRELALKISCLRGKDQKWILKRLSEEEQNTLTPLLREISELGLNRDPTIIDAVMSSINGIEESKLQASTLSKVKDLPNMPQFWQSLLLGCIEKRERASIKRKFGLKIPPQEVIEDIPPALKKTIIALATE